MASRIKQRLSAMIARDSGQAYTGTKPDLPDLGGTKERVKAGLRTGLGGPSNQLTTKDGVIPLPDEDELERVRRRRNARRGGGRASTVLSDDNRLGG